MTTLLVYLTLDDFKNIVTKLGNLVPPTSLPSNSGRKKKPATAVEI